MGHDTQPYEKERTYEEREFGVKCQHPLTLPYHPRRARHIRPSQTKYEFCQKSAAAKLTANREDSEDRSKVVRIAELLASNERPDPRLDNSRRDSHCDISEDMMPKTGNQPSTSDSPPFSPIRVPTVSTAITSPSDDSRVKATLIGSGASIC